MRALVADGSGQGDVLVAPATGPGALAIVRLTGPPGAALRVARRLAPGLPVSPPPRRALVRRFVDATGRALDEGVVLLFAAPRSATGEEVVELQCHGSRGVVDALVEAACAAGARRARPGEFTRRALANGRLDLARAEGVAGMAAAESRGEAARALGLFDGALSREVRRLREALLDLLAEVEAGLDFAEDVPLAEPAALRARIAAFVSAVEALSSAPLVRRGSGAPAVAILGRPNAGKSTLFNALLGEDRAIVTEHPGTTRDVLAEGVEIGGERVVLLDTAGLRRGAEAVEEIGIARAYEAARGAALLLYVVDGSAGTCDEDREVLSRLEAPTMLVRTKADLPAAADTALAEALAVSARSGEGIAALAEAVARALDEGPESEDPVALLARHRDALRRTRDEAAAAAKLLAEGEEYGAAALRRALHALGEITGESATDELLDRVFSGFCIGK